MHTPNDQEKYLRQYRTKLFQNQEPIKNWISSMYEVPVFSVVNWLFPMTGKMGTDRQFDKSWPWSTINWHSDSCCHPQRGGGHHVIALVIAYRRRRSCYLTIKRLILMRKENMIIYTMDGVPLLRDPLYLSPDEDELYVWNNSSTFLLDFTDPNGEEKWKKSIITILASLYVHTSLVLHLDSMSTNNQLRIIQFQVNLTLHITVDANEFVLCILQLDLVFSQCNLQASTGCGWYN